MSYIVIDNIVQCHYNAVNFHLNSHKMHPEAHRLGWDMGCNYTNPGYGLSLVDTLWNAGSYRQPLEQEGNPMT